MPEDGYDYGKHLRSIGDGTFISREQARSEASAARSGVTGLSRISRASLASKQGEILLRGVADGAFASAEELSVAVGDAVGGEVSTEDQNLEAIAEMDEDMKAALFDDETLEDLEEPDDDFVIKAGEFRETELISCPARMPKRGVYAVPEEVDEGQEGELRVDADGVAYPIASYKEVCFSLTLFSHAFLSLTHFTQYGTPHFFPHMSPTFLCLGVWGGLAMALEPGAHLGRESGGW